MNEGLSRKQFDILSLLLTAEKKLTHREIQRLAGLSLGTINRTLRELEESGLLKGGTVTEQGRAVMEHYRVKRAVFVAAGFGTRLVPVTLNTPKPLVRVNGTRLIDGLIDACLAVGIEEIYVVRGYLAEQFDQLRYKYPQVRFLENPAYNETNNISSALVARYLLCNAYVFEADLLLRDPSVIRKYHYTSDFLAIKKDRTDDWCFDVRDGVICAEKLGGLDCWQMVGISYWNEADGKKLSVHLEEAYGLPGGREKYWEQVPLSVFAGDYRVEILPCGENDVIEIDTFRELKAIDPSYDV